MPGSYLHAGEEPHAGLARELREELGLTRRQERPLRPRWRGRRPVPAENARAVARECWKAGGHGAGDASNAADVLGWDFAFEVNEMAKAIAAEANVKAAAFAKLPGPRRLPTC